MQQTEQIKTPVTYEARTKYFLDREGSVVPSHLIIAALNGNDERITALTKRIEGLRGELTRLRDCDWVISLPDRMDAVRDIARKALENDDKENL